MKPALLLLLLCALLAVVVAPAWGVEAGLGKVRLDEQVAQLVAELGAPKFIGPVGITVGKPAGEPFNAPAEPVLATRPAGTAASQPARSAPVIGRLSLSGRDRSASSTTRPRTTATARPGVPVNAVAAEPSQTYYWMWQAKDLNPALFTDARLTVALSEEGRVTGIMVAGHLWKGLQTARGITLGDSMDKVMARYLTVVPKIEGAYAVLRYPEAGLTFTFEQMRCVGICLESQPGPGTGLVSLPSVSAAMPVMAKGGSRRGGKTAGPAPASRPGGSPSLGKLRLGGR